MLKFIGKRLLTMIPVVLGISFLIFTMMSFTPGDPAVLALGTTASEEALNEWRNERDLNDPFLVRYVKFWGNVFSGNLGKSYRTNRPVAEEIADRIPQTLILATGATALMVIFGIPIGIISAVKQYTIVDAVSMLGALLLTSIPAFWLGLMLMLLFSLQLNWLPATGTETWKNFILPCVTLSAAVMASLLRMTRSNMLEVIRQDYIRTARSKGATERSIVFKHALRNALLPVITIVGLNYAGMFGGALITETVFAIPGLGSLLVSSVRMKDTPVVMVCVMLIALIIGMMNLLVDVLYVFIDPRLKTQMIRSDMRVKAHGKTES